MNDALIRMAQGELFDLLLKAEEEGKSLGEALPEVTLAVSRLVRASVAQKKWQTEFRDRIAAAADQAADIAKKGGLTEEGAEAIRKEILGVGG